MAITGRVYTKTQKVILFGSGTLVSLFLVLVGLAYLGISVETSGDQFCADTCESYFNISLQNYSLCFGSTFNGIVTDPKIPIEIYRLESNVWKPYVFKKNTCLAKNTKHQFKIVGHKNPSETIKWGLSLQGTDVDPFWYGIGNVTASTSASTNLNVEVGTPINITGNITGETYVEIDIDHPSYGINYTRGQNPSVVFVIDYFRTKTLNDFSSIKNLSYNMSGNQNQTIYIISHQYDTAKNLSINLTGFLTNGTYPEGVVIYVNNTKDVTVGALRPAGASMTTTTFNDSLTSQLLMNNTNYTVRYIQMFSKSVISKANINFSGKQNVRVPNILLNATGVSTNNSIGNITIQDSISYTNNESVGSTPGLDTRINFTGITTGFNNIHIKEFYSDSGAHNLNWTIWNYNTGTWEQLGTWSNEGTTLTSHNAAISNWNNYVSGGVVATKLTQVEIGTTASHYLAVDYTNLNSTTISDFTMEVGTVDGYNEFSYAGYMPQSQYSTGTGAGFAVNIQNYLAICSPDINGYCNVPVYFFAQGGQGWINASALIVNYTGTPNPIYLNINYVKSFLNSSSGSALIPIKFTNTANGTIQISDIRYDYLGGSKVTEFKVHNATYTTNQTMNITSYYSDWDYNFPYKINYLEFIPKSATSKNVTPYGQTTNSPIFNITTYNYAKSADLYCYLNNSNSAFNYTNIDCVDLYLSTSNQKPTTSLFDNLIVYYPFDKDARTLIQGDDSNATIEDLDSGTGTLLLDCGGVFAYQNITGVHRNGTLIYSTGGDGLVCMLKTLSTTGVPANYTVYFYGKGYVRGMIYNGTTISDAYEVGRNCKLSLGQDIYTTCNAGLPYSDWKLFKLITPSAATGTIQVYLYNKGTSGIANNASYDYISTKLPDVLGNTPNGTIVGNVTLGYDPQNLQARFKFNNNLLDELGANSGSKFDNRLTFVSGQSDYALNNPGEIITINQIATSLSSYAFGNTARPEIAQNFVAPSGYLTSIGIRRNSDTGTVVNPIIVSIRNDSGGNPGININSVTLSADDWHNVSTSVTTYFTIPTILTAGQTYWIVFNQTPVDDTNQPRIWLNGTGGYGTFKNSTGTVWYTVSAYSLNFATKVSDYVIIPNNMTLTYNNFAITWWMKKGLPPTDYKECIFSSYLGKRSGYLADPGTGFLLFKSNNGAVQKTFGPGGIDNLNTWQHYALISNSSHMCLYKNATLVECETQSADTTNQVFKYIGAPNWHGESSTPEYCRALNGSLDDVRFYNQTLTTSDINLVYTNADITRNGYYYNFPGVTGNYINVTPVTENLQDGSFTISAWAKLAKTLANGDNGTIVAIRDAASSNDIIFALQKQTGIDPYVILSVWNNTAFNIVYNIDADIVKSGAWHMYTGVYNNTNGANLTIYIDGVFKNSSTARGTRGGTGAQYIRTNKFLIGADQASGAPGKFNGSIDNVMYWNRMLSSSEISSLYSQQSSSNSYIKLYDTWQLFGFGKNYLGNERVWLWADYNCNYSTWKLWQPDLYFKACCQNCTCSEDLT
jgi:hypothetical protein